MIALFDRFPRITLKRDLGIGTEGLLMGIMKEHGVAPQGLVILEDGTVTIVDAGYFQVSYHYDATKDKWIDPYPLDPDHPVDFDEST